LVNTEPLDGGDDRTDVVGSEHGALDERCPPGADRLGYERPEVWHTLNLGRVYRARGGARRGRRYSKAARAPERAPPRSRDLGGGRTATTAPPCAIYPAMSDTSTDTKLVAVQPIREAMIHGAGRGRDHLTEDELHEIVRARYYPR